MSRELEEIIQDYESTRASYRDFTQKSEVNRDSLIEFESRFVDLKADLRGYKSNLTASWTRRDDKAATAIKYRLAVAIHEGEHKDYNECSINQAEKFASGSKEYKEFVDQRAF